MRLEDRCVHSIELEEHMKIEKALGLERQYHKGFEDMGCDKCDGYNTKCSAYFSMEELYNE